MQNNLSAENPIHQAITEIFIRYITTLMPAQNTLFLSMPGNEISYPNGVSIINGNLRDIVIFDASRLEEGEIFKKLKNNSKKRLIIIFNLEQKGVGFLERISNEDSVIIGICIYKIADFTKGIFARFTSILPLPMLDLDNIREIVELFKNYFKVKLPANIENTLMILGGGNISLTLGILNQLNETGGFLQKDSRLVENHSINSTLGKIFEIISKEPLERLIKFGFLNKNGTLFSKLLESYLEGIINPDLKVLFPDLTKSDVKLLTIFLKNPNTIIERQIFELILNSELSVNLDWGVYKAIERMKNKVKKTVKIKMVKGQGWLLETKK